MNSSPTHKNGRRELERHHRRELLLEAAARVFGSKPFDEATMQDVAAEAEIGMQGLYEHFRSKQELYEEIALERARGFQARSGAIHGGSGTPLEQLRRLGLAYIEEFGPSKWHFQMNVRNRASFDWDESSRFARLRDIYRQEIAHLRRIVERCVAAGDLRPLDPGLLAQLFVNVLDAALHSYFHLNSREEAQETADRALGCFLEGVGKRE